MSKKRTPSRQVRRAAARRRAKRLPQKKQEQKGNQRQKETQQPDKSKRRLDWKFVIDTVLKLVLILLNILSSCG